MMDTLRKVVSDIVNDVKASNLDDRFSYRFLASKFIGRADNILRQDIQDRQLLLINDIWMELKCIELEYSSYASCNILYEGDEILKRSKYKIPQTYATKYGNLIKILNIKFGPKYFQIKADQYESKVNREYPNKQLKYFWILDDYLYIADTLAEEVKGLGVFKNSQEVDFFNGKIDCCYKPLDSIVTLPQYIIDIAKKDVVNDLLNRTKINEDNSPDLNNLKK